MVRVRCEVCFALLPGFKSSEHRTVRCSASGALRVLQTSLSLGPVCTGRVQWQFAQRPVLCWLPLDSDTWLTLEHWTQVLSRSARHTSNDPYSGAYTCTLGLSLEL